MAPRLRVSAGPSVDKLSLLRVNDEEHPMLINNEHFEGRIVVRIQDFTGVRPGKSGENDKESANSVTALHSSYFDHGHAKGLTWSIQVQGRFKKNVSANDLVFGNKFDKPIRDKLPWGTSVALRAIGIIDPSLKHDVYCDEPWAFGPLLTSVSRINIDRNEEKYSGSGRGSQGDGTPSFDNWPAFPAGKDESDYVHDDTSVLLCKPDDSKALLASVEEQGMADLSTLSQLRDPKSAHTNRARFWANQSTRDAVEVLPQDIVTLDFCPAVPLDFNTLRVVLPYTNGMGFDLQKYWDGQPVRYYCKDANTNTVFFVVECVYVRMSDAQWESMAAAVADLSSYFRLAAQVPNRRKRRLSFRHLLLLSQTHRTFDRNEAALT